LSVSTIGLYYLGNIAVNNIFATATIANGTAYADGVYQGSGQGFQGTVTVEVTISGGKITTITTVSESDDAQYDNAFSTLVPEIIANQSTSGVNTVSNATYSSKGILAAVSDASKSGNDHFRLDFDQHRLNQHSLNQSCLDDITANDVRLGYGLRLDFLFHGHGRHVQRRHLSGQWHRLP
jgi:uncharacterized protein with FMN-binding domain